MGVLAGTTLPYVNRSPDRAPKQEVLGLRFTCHRVPCREAPLPRGQEALKRGRGVLPPSGRASMRRAARNEIRMAGESHPKAVLASTQTRLDYQTGDLRVAARNMRFKPGLQSSSLPLY